MEEWTNVCIVHLEHTSQYIFGDSVGLPEAQQFLSLNFNSSDD